MNAKEGFKGIFYTSDLHYPFTLTPRGKKKKKKPCIEGLLIRVAIERQWKLQVVKPEWVW